MCLKAICSRRWHPVGVGSSSFRSQNGADTRHRETGRLLLRACVGIIEARKRASRSDGWLERAMCRKAICSRRWHPVGVGSSSFRSQKWCRHSAPRDGSVFYCGLVWASSRRGNERAVPMGGLSERCAARLFARDDGIPWAWGAQVSRAKMVPALGTARRVGCYCGLVWASSRRGKERAVPMGGLSERCAYWLFACDDGIPWAWGAQFLTLPKWCRHSASRDGSVATVGLCGHHRGEKMSEPFRWRRHTMQASSFFGSSACLPRSASVFLVLNTHNGGTRLAKTSHFRLVLRPSGPRRGVDLKAFAVSHVPCKCLRTSSGCWLMSSCSISRMRNNERVRGPRPLFAPKTSVRRFVRTTVVLVLTGSSWLGSCETGVGEECYLVDPASSHMLVSKIKPCMYKRSTRALPVAAMIHDNSTDRTALVPATHHSNFCPINFRCWTLGWAGRSASGVHRSSRPFCRRCAPGLNWPGRASGAVTLKKLECSKQAYALYTLAWDNIIGFRRTTAKAFAKDVFINQERKLGARRRSDTVLVSTINDADQGSADVAYRTPPAPYEKSKSLGSGGSMVARLKLKGIDGRAPPGVEPAA
ncbi:hypothetical protein BUALT_BualtUnG0008800 [Buddleja alternifolia]|uniref:Uncharacterized protein n=1 Tax=Buddleja alternifolia TaxID=168488 RepID=A0AAV6W1H4_9LAMI|nr:hypothetical protein BUALT_BualtUnG0008800 [Buddleja alternifolia]